ncbi:amidase [Neogemmobacter tilapiae]|uniref:Amidase n=1 Tax=Neogemmobacter tilapiae TaxID=875041 RepID=A0A918TSQ0_9RHOB|nr:amidase [Gemmobacter tilapiae]GHC60195.1 amidase [Gemmobacter tilapiae]
MNPADLSLPDAAHALRNGTLTSENLTQAVLERIATQNPRLHAFTHIATDALEQARQADALLAAGQDPGPFCGLPVAVKDLIDVQGQPATSGSRVLADRIAPADAAALSRLRAQGAVLIGKVATYEFAMVGPDLTLPDPPARNPWNPAHITGGSSSGSAAAVASGMVRLAIGTDTGGSIRSPSAYCGCVGLKPTYDRVSRSGAFPLSPSLDHIGPLAATVEEAALALDMLTENPNQWRPAAGRLTQGVAGLRIGYARNWFADDPQASPALIRAMDDAAAQLSMLGAAITLVDLPDYPLYEAAGSIILHAEALDAHRALIQDKSDLYGRPTLQCLAFGAAIDPAELAQAHQAQTRLTAEMDQAMAPFDLLILPTTLTPALPFSAFDGEKAVWTPMRTIAFNVTGQPALSLPMGFDGALPLGLQIVGRKGDEDLICAAGHAFERATDHSVQRPPL